LDDVVSYRARRNYEKSENLMSRDTSAKPKMTAMTNLKELGSSMSCETEIEPNMSAVTYLKSLAKLATAAMHASASVLPTKSDTDKLTDLRLSNPVTADWDRLGSIHYVNSLSSESAVDESQFQEMERVLSSATGDLSRFERAEAAFFIVPTYQPLGTPSQRVNGFWYSLLNRSTTKSSGDSSRQIQLRKYVR